MDDYSLILSTPEGRKAELAFTQEVVTRQP